MTLKEEYLKLRPIMLQHQYNLDFLDRWAREADQDAKAFIKKVKEYRYTPGTSNEIVDGLDGY